MNNIKKTVTQKLTYLGQRATVVTDHYDSNRIGLRRVTTTWIDDAHELNGGHKAGTVVTKVIKGDGRYSSGPKAYELIEAESIVS